MNGNQPFQSPRSADNHGTETIYNNSGDSGDGGDSGDNNKDTTMKSDMVIP